MFKKAEIAPLKKIAKKKKVAIKEKFNVMETFLKAIHELYPEDRTRPGLVLSWIAQRKVFYASLVRYQIPELHDGNACTQKKVILFSAEGPTINEALTLLAKRWKSGTEHVRKMRKMIPEIAWDDEISPNW
jgi:hypothetical protein